MPLAAVFPEDAATSAFNALWCNLKARLANPVPAANLAQRRSAAFAKAIVHLIVKLGGEADDNAVPDEFAPDVALPAPSAEEQAGTHRIRLEVSGEDAFESLGLKTSGGTPVGTTRLAHIFDTDDGVLLRDGYLLQLLEEPGAFAVALETLQRSNGTVYQHEEIQVATIDRGWAADILAGCLSPIKVLERRLGRPLPKQVSAVATAAGKQSVQRVTWRRRLRRHLGPILIPYDKTRVTLNFEFDQISGPDSKVDYEIEATATGLSARSCEQALRQLFSHAGINWQPSMDRHLPVPSNGKNGRHKLTAK
jgi:hypothetical protein